MIDDASVPAASAGTKGVAFDFGSDTGGAGDTHALSGTLEFGQSDVFAFDYDWEVEFGFLRLGEEIDDFVKVKSVRGSGGRSELWGSEGDIVPPEFFQRILHAPRSP